MHTAKYNNSVEKSQAYVKTGGGDIPPHYAVKSTVNRTRPAWDLETISTCPLMCETSKYTSKLWAALGGMPFSRITCDTYIRDHFLKKEKKICNFGSMPPTMAQVVLKESYWPKYFNKMSFTCPRAFSMAQQ